MSGKDKTENMTIKEFQFLIKHIEQGSLKEEKRDERNLNGKKENGQRLILKLIEEFGELAENIRKNIRYTGNNIKGTIEEELFDIFYYIAAIANDYGIDLEEIFYIKDELNKIKYSREFTIEEGREKYKKLKKEGKVK
ncbi:MazG nucleotide pyrophosphohydrolase domain-containing protein [Leptotrichia sp. OH3620_COT-345]|uniref:MazG nucleotide pyrophosphohydrolase domain-containing protein n=1 Tax=Leptotrichia sp. OH3620_COT-345 TaxID=2491048 RepID=UPI001F42B92E|nr:MazG nucleotide pyrophosphohydrolase domain-containing protein [Leptotrichia sp. OH3620_COT-345]